jgi:hypothetical protein
MDIRLDNSVSSAMIKGESYNVLDYENYRKSQSLWDMGSIAVVEKINNDIYILPYRGEYVESKNLQPGIYSSGCLDFEVLPKGPEEENYKNIPIVTISSNDDIETILEKENVLSRLAEPWITSPDNITQIPIKDSDEPAMKALKMAINNKGCDIDKYQARFGQNFPNDKRQLKNSSVTLKITQRYCDNLDMEAILTIRNKSDDVPNPLKSPVSISLSTGEFINTEAMNFNLDEDDSSEDFYTEEM